LKIEFRKVRPQIPESILIRIQYGWYADAIIGINGPGYIAKEIKEKRNIFLKQELGLTLSEEKTKITYVREHFVRFLGYSLKIDTSRKIESYRNKNGSYVTIFNGEQLDI
jgi:hypothetical protein